MQGHWHLKPEKQINNLINAGLDCVYPSNHTINGYQVDVDFWKFQFFSLGGFDGLSFPKIFPSPPSPLPPQHFGYLTWCHQALVQSWYELCDLLDIFLQLKY